MRAQSANSEPSAEPGLGACDSASAKLHAIHRSSTSTPLAAGGAWSLCVSWPALYLHAGRCFFSADTAIEDSATVALDARLRLAAATCVRLADVIKPVGMDDELMLADSSDLESVG